MHCTWNGQLECFILRQHCYSNRKCLYVLAPGVIHLIMQGAASGKHKLKNLVWMICLYTNHWYGETNFIIFLLLTLPKFLAFQVFTEPDTSLHLLLLKIAATVVVDCNAAVLENFLSPCRNATIYRGHSIFAVLCEPALKRSLKSLSKIIPITFLPLGWRLKWRAREWGVWQQCRASRPKMRGAGDSNPCRRRCCKMLRSSAKVRQCLWKYFYYFVRKKLLCWWRTTPAPFGRLYCVRFFQLNLPQFFHPLIGFLDSSCSHLDCESSAITTGSGNLPNPCSFPCRTSSLWSFDWL